MNQSKLRIMLPWLQYIWRFACVAVYLSNIVEFSSIDLWFGGLFEAKSIVTWNDIRLGTENENGNTKRNLD